MASNIVEILVGARDADAKASLDGIKAKLEELAHKVATAKVNLAGNKEAEASLDRLGVKLVSLDHRTSKPNIKIEGILRSVAEIEGLDLALDKLMVKEAETTGASAGLGAALSSLTGGGMSPMQALIGSAVALAPVLVTVGFGLAGLGAAAFGILDPIKKAATATGGLQANLHTLDPASQEAARAILGLGKDYSQFEAALKPTVLKDLNAAIGAVKPLMAGLEPVAKATGNALAGMFSTLGATFKSSEWQQFFQFMARTAGGDMQMLTGVLNGLLRALPPLLEALQPIASGFLQVANATLIAAQAMEAYGQAADNFSSKQNANVQIVEQHTSAIGKLGFAVFSLFGDYKGAVSWQNSFSTQVERGGHLVSTSVTQYQSLASAVGALTAQYVKGLTPLEAYIGATITQKNDEVALKTALEASAGRIGLKTQKQRDSFSAAQQYVKDTLASASAAVASHQGTQKEINSLSTAIGVLESVKGKTADYRAELQLLKDMLDKIRMEKDITKYVTVVTRDVNQGSAPGSGVLKGGQTFHASGGIIGAASGGARGGMTWVGEQGPELVRLPYGSMVYSNAQSRAMASGGGGGDTYNVTVRVAPGTSPAETGRQIAYFLGEFKKRGGKIYAPAGF